MKGQSKNPRSQERIFEVEGNEERPSYVDTPFELMPWEQSNQFELLLTEVAEALLPEGPLEEDEVLTIARNKFLKERHRKIRAAKNKIARLNPYHAAFDHRLALICFSLEMMKDGVTKEDIEINLKAVGKELGQQLREKCPEYDFSSPGERAKAMLREVKEINSSCEQPDELLMEQAAALMTPEELVKELDLEERYDAGGERALDRLLKLKELRRRTTVAERLRFITSHPMRLARR